MSKKRKVLLIVNPCAGRNKSRAGTFDIVDKFSKENYEFDIKTTTCPGDATNIVKEHIGDNDMVVCCGGDGTLNETINGIMQLSRRVPVGYIPAGSTNDLAATLGIPTGDIKEATDMIIDGHTNGYDIGLFNNRFFSYVASFGPAAKLSYATSQKLKNKFGRSAYYIDGIFRQMIPLLKEVKPIHIKIEYDGGVIEDDFFFGAISNSTSVAGLFKYDENDVRLDDGVFEVILVRRLKRATDAFAMIEKIKRRDYDGDKLLYLKTSSIKLTFDKPCNWTLDGEYGGDHTDVRISVLPRAIDICSPENPLFVGDKDKVKSK